MKVFAINLERHENKKEYIINECLRHGIDVEIIKAIDGSILSDDYIKSVVFDYPNFSLTKGEIGCVLSHNVVYKKLSMKILTLHSFLKMMRFYVITLTILLMKLII